MEKFTNSRESDIAQEKYQGPSAEVAAAGNGFVKHFVWAIAGLGAGSAVALFFPNRVKSTLEALRKPLSITADAEKTPVGWIKNSWNSATKFILGEGPGAVKMDALNPEQHAWLEHSVISKEHGFGHWFSSHAAGLLPWVGTRYKKMLTDWRSMGEQGERWSNVLTAGGVTALGGWLAGWIGGLLDGHRLGGAGKRQFERAQVEIRNQREINQDLERINDELHERYKKAASRLDALKHDTIRVAPDDPRRIREDSDNDRSDADSPKAPHSEAHEKRHAAHEASSKAHSITHEGALHGHREHAHSAG